MAGVAERRRSCTWAARAGGRALRARVVCKGWGRVWRFLLSSEDGRDSNARGLAAVVAIARQLMFQAALLPSQNLFDRRGHGNARTAPL